MNLWFNLCLCILAITILVTASPASKHDKVKKARSSATADKHGAELDTVEKKKTNGNFRKYGIQKRKLPISRSHVPVPKSQHLPRYDRFKKRNKQRNQKLDKSDNRRRKSGYNASKNGMNKHINNRKPSNRPRSPGKLNKNGKRTYRQKRYRSKKKPNVTPYEWKGRGQSHKLGRNERMQKDEQIQQNVQVHKTKKERKTAKAPESVHKNRGRQSRTRDSKKTLKRSLSKGRKHKPPKKKIQSEEDISGEISSKEYSGDHSTSHPNVNDPGQDLLRKDVHETSTTKNLQHQQKTENENNKVQEDKQLKQSEQIQTTEEQKPRLRRPVQWKRKPSRNKGSHSSREDHSASHPDVKDLGQNLSRKDVQNTPTTEKPKYQQNTENGKIQEDKHAKQIEQVQTTDEQKPRLPRPIQWKRRKPTTRGSHSRTTSTTPVPQNQKPKAQEKRFVPGDIMNLFDPDYDFVGDPLYENSKEKREYEKHSRAMQEIVKQEHAENNRIVVKETRQFLGNRAILTQDLHSCDRLINGICYDDEIIKCNKRDGKNNCIDGIKLPTVFRPNGDADGPKVTGKPYAFTDTPKSYALEDVHGPEITFWNSY